MNAAPEGIEQRETALLDPGDPEPAWILVEDAIGDEAFDTWVIDDRGCYAPLDRP